MVTPLNYRANLTLPEARARLGEVRQAFDGVKRNYSGFFSKFKRNIADADNKTLVDCVGVLLPLNMQPSVQREIGDRNLTSSSTVFFKLVI